MLILIIVALVLLISLLLFFQEVKTYSKIHTKKTENKDNDEK